jgi:hypothetical protein
MNGPRSTSFTGHAFVAEPLHEVVLGFDDLVGGTNRGVLEHAGQRCGVGLVHRAPGRAADAGHEGIRDVAGEVDIRLDLVELLGLDRRQRVLPGVDGALLQRQVDSAKAMGDGLAPTASRSIM